jgi:hypothetical protein
MAKAVLIAFASPTSAEDEAEFNDWYANSHIGQVREAIPAVSRVTRYRVVDPTGANGPSRYVAVYEIDGTDALGAAAALGAYGQAGKFDMTSTMDATTNPPAMFWGEPV